MTQEDGGDKFEVKPESDRCGRGYLKSKQK
jgi:hypothetical protein